MPTSTTVLRNRDMDIASWPWLNPIMRSGFLALCGLCVFPCVVFSQNTWPPTIVDHPAGSTVQIGDTATLSVKVESQPPLTFQWYKNDQLLLGKTTSTFTTDPFTANDLGVFTFYHVVATNDIGPTRSANAVVHVTKRAQTIAFAPATTTAIAGSGITLDATASSNLPVTFTLVSGAASLNGKVLIGSGGNVVVRASQPGDATCAAAEPVERTFSFVAGTLSPFITSPPVDQTANAGSSVALRATAIGTPAPTYQWHKDGIAIAGATNPVLTLENTTLADSGRYAITATNASGAATATTTVTIRAAPVITSAPIDRTVFAGETATFAVTATGFPVPTFQWRRNGTPLPGATNPTLSVASALSTNTGRYDVIATNLLGSTTSAAATLTVNTRDFSGTYFGRFAGATGDFVLHVRADRSALFLGHLPAAQTGLSVLNLRVELAGTFSTVTTTIASAREISAFEALPDTAAAPQPVTLRGTLDEVAGTVRGTIAELNATFEGTRASRSGPASSAAGVYPVALVGSASGRGHVVVAPNGETFVLMTDGSALDAARGTLDATNRLVATSSSGATIDLGFANGAVSGSARTAAGATVTIAGANDARTGSEHVANLSIRTVTSPGAATLITGFVVTGAAPKQLLIRAAGPALALAPFNVPNALPDPTLQLFRGSTAMAQNDDWGAPATNAAAITAAAARAGAFPFRPGSADAALLTTLAPGAYSVSVGGGTGTVLAEIYEVLENSEAPGARRLVNVSARGIVTPAAPFIAGFVITGTAPQRVLIRGIGPTLGAAPFNVAGALPNPQLTLLRGATTVKSNDDWFRDPEAALIRDASTQVGAFALGVSSLDAAMLLYLEPGAYTVQIGTPANANPGAATGLALLEIYESAP